MQLCTPIIVYLTFSITFIAMSFYNKQYNDVAKNILNMVLVSIVLWLLCEKGLTAIAWLLVFVPLIFMTIIGFTLALVLTYKIVNQNKKFESVNDLKQ